MKKGYHGNVEQITIDNTNFRSVLYTGANCQLVAMSLLPGEDIGIEVHAENDQFLRFEKGNGRVLVNDTEYTVADGDAVIVPAGASHNVTNTSETESLKLYTLYAPPHRREGVVHTTKQYAESDDEDFDGVTTEVE